MSPAEHNYRAAVMNDELDDAIALLRATHVPPPLPTRLPTPEEVESLERALGKSLHESLRRYLLEASDVCAGTLEPATITLDGSATQMTEVLASVRSYCVPEELLPLCEDNERSPGTSPWTPTQAASERERYALVVVRQVTRRCQWDGRAD